MANEDASRATALAALHRLGPKAVEILAAKLNDQDYSSSQLEAAQEVLDRIGIRRVASSS